MTLTQPYQWLPADEGMKRLGFADRRELGKAIADGRVKARRRGRERQVAVPVGARPPSDERLVAPAPPVARPATPRPEPRFASAPGGDSVAAPHSGLSPEEASILSEPVASASAGADEPPPLASRRRPAAPALAHLDRDMRLLRDRVETIAETIERLAHRDAAPAAAGRSDAAPDRFGEVCERIEELQRTVSSAALASGEKRLVVEATVIPPGRGFADASPSAAADAPPRRTDPFSALRSRPSPAPDYRPGRGGAGAGFARLLVALAIIAFSFLTGTLILAFV